jgi:hypothetical protein
MHKYPKWSVFGMSEIEPSAGRARPTYLTCYVGEAYLLKAVLRRKE